MKKIFLLILFLALLLVATLTAQASNDAIVDARSGVVRLFNQTSSYNGNIGTAFVVSHIGDETILFTNRHCVESNPDEVYIVTSNIHGTLVKADVSYLSSDTKFDLAMLRTERLDGYIELPLASSDKVVVSEDVYALGFPALVDGVVDKGEDLPSTIDDMTITRGIISNARVVVNSFNYYQTDATITGGNSGGPLLNKDGAVVGVNTLRTIDSEGYNYAIYIDYIIDHLEREGIPYTKYEPEEQPQPSVSPPVTDAHQTPSPPPLQNPPPAGSLAGTTWELVETYDGTTALDKAALDAAGLTMTIQFFENGSALSEKMGAITEETYLLSGVDLTITSASGEIMTGNINGSILTLYGPDPGMVKTLHPVQEPTSPSADDPTPTPTQTETETEAPTPSASAQSSPHSGTEETMPSSSPENTNTSGGYLWVLIVVVGAGVLAGLIVYIVQISKNIHQNAPAPPASAVSRPGSYPVSPAPPASAVPRPVSYPLPPVSYPKSIQPVSSPSSAAQTRLYCTKGLFAGRYYPVTETLYIGRDPQRCQIVFPEYTGGISAMHCCVRQLGSEILLTDMGSKYGTFLSGGSRLNANASVALIPGDCFYLADKGNEFMIN